MIDKKKLEVEWFHGDQMKTNFLTRNYFDVTDFSRDRNAMGPGIYFTVYKWQAKGYAEPSGYVYTAKMNLDPKRVLLDNTKIDVVKLRKFIQRCPDKESLLNYSQNIKNAPEVALKLNMESSDNMHEALMGLYNDLYQRDASLFAKVMTEIGYDAFYHRVNPEYEPGAIHLIVYNPNIIEVIKEERIDQIKENMKHLLLFEDFSDPGMGVQIINVSPEKMASLKVRGALVKSIEGGIGIVANKLAKSLGKDKPLDAFKKIYRSWDKIAFIKK